MFRTLFVPLDGTQEAMAALPPALALARATGAAIVLARVVPRPRDESDLTAVQEAEQFLQRIAAELVGAGMRGETTVLVGDVAPTLLREARRQQADCIVMATHGRSGLGRAVLGSVTERIVAESPVPVLLVRPGGVRMHRPASLLVPLDGTPGGSVALGLAVGLAQATGAKLVLLRVVQPLPAYLYEGLYWSGGAHVDPSWDEENRQAAQTYVDGMASRVQRAGVTAEGHAILGNVPETIVATARQLGVDAIVMSTHALTGPARAILGSVADAVVRTADRPVLLIRRDAPVAVPAARRAARAADAAKPAATDS